MPDSSLPDEIVQSIAIANAKSIGEQPAILANLALANQIFNNNLQQQMAISYQQAVNEILLAAVAKCVNQILAASSADRTTGGAVKEMIAALKQFQVEVKAPTVPPAS